MLLKKEIPGLVVTGARYGIAEHMARRVRANKPIGLALTSFILADILDGELLRSLDLDTPIRRIADGVVDHASEARVAYEVGAKNPAARPYIGVLAVRAALVGGINALHLALTGEATKGQNKQRATSLATAVFGATAASGNKTMTHLTGIFASGIAIATIIPHLRGVGKKHDKGIREL